MEPRVLLAATAALLCSAISEGEKVAESSRLSLIYVMGFPGILQITEYSYT